MLYFPIPGYADLHVRHLVLDYNGTLAVDGIPLTEALVRLSELSNQLSVYVITADSHGTVRTHLQDRKISVQVLVPGDHCQQKRDFVTRLGSSQTIAIGNGFNDHLMLKEAALGFAVVQQEGLSSQTLVSADLVFTSIVDALDCIMNPLRLIASLRR